MVFKNIPVLFANRHPFFTSYTVFIFLVAAAVFYFLGFYDNEIFFYLLALPAFLCLLIQSIIISLQIIKIRSDISYLERNDKKFLLIKKKTVKEVIKDNKVSIKLLEIEFLPLYFLVAFASIVTIADKVNESFTPRIAQVEFEKGLVFSDFQMIYDHINCKDYWTIIPLKDINKISSYTCKNTAFYMNKIMLDQEPVSLANTSIEDISKRYAGLNLNLVGNYSKYAKSYDTLYNKGFSDFKDSTIKLTVLAFTMFILFSKAFKSKLEYDLEKL